MSVYKNDADLQGLWLMEEASGTRADYTPNNNDLADNNTVGSSADAQEGALSADFEDTTSEYLSITDAAQTGLDITGNITLGCWIKPESLPGTASVAGLITKYLAASNQRGYILALDQNGALVFILSPEGVTISQTLTPNGTIVAGNWYHVVAVYNGVDQRIYVNGSLANTPLAYTSGIFNGTAAFQLGRRDGSTIEYDGLMDEVAVFSRALSATEVNDWYNEGILDPGQLILLDEDMLTAGLQSLSGGLG